MTGIANDPHHVRICSSPNTCAWVYVPRRSRKFPSDLKSNVCLFDKAFSIALRVLYNYQGNGEQDDQASCK
jgi:hypothetical protein